MARKRRPVWILLPIAVALIGGAIYFYAGRLTAPAASVVQQTDPLCGYVESKRLRCVAILGADTLLGPGAIVDYAADAAPHAPVPLPVAALFSSSCLVPGAQSDALKASAKQQNSVSVPTLHYKLDRGLGVGTSIPVPKLAGLELKAGPKISELRELALTVPAAWVQMVDENVFLDAFESSGIRAACVDRLLEQKYQIVSAALIGKGIEYQVTDASNQTYSASLAAEKGIVSLGADSHAQDDATAKLASTDPLVMGVTFLKTDGLKSRAENLKKPVVWAASGSAQLSATGAGGERHMVDQRASAPLGQAARLNATGTEPSACGGASATSSRVAGESRVASADGKSLDFIVDLEVRGGRNATANDCAGSSGRETSTTAALTLTGSIRCTVRAPGPRWLELDAVDFPDDSVVSVEAPDGSAVSAEGGAGTRAAIKGATKLRFRLKGDGVYIITVTSAARVTASGVRSVSIRKHGALKASTAPIVATS